jgi:hypothetical protein
MEKKPRLHTLVPLAEAGMIIGINSIVVVDIEIVNRE